MSGCSFPRRVVPILISVAAFVTILSPPAAAQDGDFSSVILSDHLSVVTRAPGVPDNAIYAGFENNESVSLFNGNLLINHPATPTYSLDGGQTVGLSRVYNSKNAAFERYRSVFHPTTCDVSNGYSTSGDSWIGFGWDMHVGRLFEQWTRSSFGCDEGSLRGKKFFEDPLGTRIQWSPGITQASPILRVQFFTPTPEICVDINPCPPHCDGSDPETPPVGCSHCGEECVVVPAEPAHYIVTQPDGTQYYMEELVSAQLSALGHTLNHGRNGWYTTKISDVHGNTSWIYYGECSTGGEACVRDDQCSQSGDTCDLGIYPESIRSIQVQRTGETSPLEVIRTDLWDSNEPTDVADPDWNSEADGRLQYLETLGPSGQYSSYKYVYTSESTTIEDDDGIPHLIPFGVLSRVDLPSVGGTATGSVAFGYNQGLGGSVGQLNTAYGPVIDHVSYPLGGESAYTFTEYESGVSVMERGPLSPFNQNPWTVFYYRQRRDFGVGKRTIYPDGQSDGSNYSWSWNRQLTLADLSADTSGIGCNNPVQNFSMTDPIGRVTKTTYGGHSCGGSYGDGLHGWPKVDITSENGDPLAGPLRTVDHAYYSETSNVFGNTGEINVLENQTTTTFHDDTGGCFGAGGSGPAKTMTTYRHQLDKDDPTGEDGWYFWRVERIEGDYLADRRLVYTHYLDPDETPGSSQQANHVLGTYDYQLLREGDSGFNRLDRAYTFNGKGQLTRMESIQDWNAETSMPSDWDTWDPGAPSTAGVSKLTTDHTYFSNGNLERLDFSGIDTYPDGSSSNQYSADFTWQLGTASTVQVGNSTEFPYLSQDVTPDAAGFVTSARDPNGVQSTFSYDALGRLTEITPVGPEYPTRVVYPDLKTTRVIQSPGVEITHDVAEPEQLFTEQRYDGLGRPIESLDAMPDGTLAYKVTRYDPMGRIVFFSEWLSASDYATATNPWKTWDVDLDGDSIADYAVRVPQTSSGAAWGTTTFYGIPGASPHEDNPLRVIPDALGRVKRVAFADGSVVDTNYCGPHKEVITNYNACPMPPCDSAVSQFYYDGFGRLALVDTPPGGADAEYRYDALGNLTKVNLIPDTDMTADSFEAWKAAAFPDGQVRTFVHNAAGRLESVENPENGLVTYDGYDVWGNLLTYQDAQATKRGYHFKNTYDNAGRLTKLERVLGTPATPQATDELRITSGSAGFDDMLDWTEGTITADTFTAGASKWANTDYSTLPCISAPPDGGGPKGLYMGWGCRYSTVPAAAQALRAHLTGVTRDDTISFKYWRHVREGGTGATDILSVFVVDATNPTDSTALKNVLFIKDDSDPSFKAWRRTQAMRPGDYFDDWSEDDPPRNLYLYVVFEKADAANPGMSAGVLLDDFFVGRRGTERLAEYVYDVDSCASGAAGEACIVYPYAPNRSKGQLAEQRSYHDDRLIATKLFAYKGLNGRLSGEANQIDWAGVGQTDNFVVRREFEPHGLEDNWTTYLAGVEEPRTYDKSYVRGLLTGLKEDLPTDDPFLHQTLPGIEYTAGSIPKAIRFHSGATRTMTVDLMNRPLSIQVTEKGGAMQWDSGTYQYDALGNIIAIGDATHADGDQKFTYDAHGRIVSAIVFGQAREVEDATTPFEIGYSYDEYGNITNRTWNTSAHPTPPPGLIIDSRTHSANRIVSEVVTSPEPMHVFDYDLNGNMTRLPSALDPAEHVTWDPLNRMMAYARLDDTIERYLYDAEGYRVLSYPEDGGRSPVISIRTGRGQLVSQYRKVTSLAEPVLDKDFLYGAGQLLVERTVSGVFQTVTPSAPLYANNQYSFQVTAGDDGGPYSVDIRTASGAAVQLTGVILDGNGTFALDESLFSTTEANFIRIRSDSGEPSMYSAPVSLVIDPTVDANSENQVMAMAVGRDGNTVNVSWRFFSPSSDPLNLYYIPNAGAPVLLTAVPLLAGVKEYSLQTQALVTQCVDFVSQRAGFTEFSEFSPLPTTAGQDIAVAVEVCTGPPPPPPLLAYNFSDTMQHRDHLGSLRVATDAAGWMLSEHDFYPFGIEITPDANTDVTGGSRMRFTGHQRDSSTQLDYMMARYASSASGRFLSIDPLLSSGRRDLPQAWNRYSEVLNDPLNRFDPDGLTDNRNDEEKEMMSDPDVAQAMGEALVSADNLHEWGFAVVKTSGDYSVPGGVVTSKSRRFVRITSPPGTNARFHTHVSASLITGGYTDPDKPGPDDAKNAKKSGVPGYAMAPSGMMRFDTSGNWSWAIDGKEWRDLRRQLRRDEKARRAEEKIKRKKRKNKKKPKPPMPEPKRKRRPSDHWWLEQTEPSGPWRK